MDLITAKEIAEKWGVTPRRVQWLCSHGRIEGAVRFGPVWMIPKNAEPPKSRASAVNKQMPMPRESPFLDMTDLYRVPGTADQTIASLADHSVAQFFLEAQIACRRGEMYKVYDSAKHLMHAHPGFYAQLGGAMLLAQCAVWRGDIHLWNDAKRLICEAPCGQEKEREILSLVLAIIDSALYDNHDYPEWFTSGSFEPLPADSLPSVKVYYIKYLYMTAFAIASKQRNVDGIYGLALMRLIPCIIEPMIRQAMVDETVLVEIYLRLSCAVAYHNVGEKAKSLRHIDKAIALALPDRLYGVLTEYVRHFEGVLEERIALVDPEAQKTVTELAKAYSAGWAKLSGAIRNRNITTDLTPKEREIAKLTAFGFSVKEVAGMLYVSESTIKQTISRIIRKTGIQDKSEFIYIL